MENHKEENSQTRCEEGHKTQPPFSQKLNFKETLMGERETRRGEDEGFTSDNDEVCEEAQAHSNSMEPKGEMETIAVENELLSSPFDFIRRLAICYI